MKGIPERTGFFIMVAVLALGCAPAVRFNDTPLQRSIPEGEEKRPVAVRDTLPETSDEAKPAPADHPTSIDIDQMNRVIATYMSTPYQRGGSGKLGLDCSGFVYVVYRDYDGTRLPLTVESQYHLNNTVRYDDLTYGDLVFFRSEQNAISHVGIYIGNDKFIHASESRGVTIDDLTSEHFSPRYAGARRVK